MGLLLFITITALVLTNQDEIKEFSNTYTPQGQHYEKETNQTRDIKTKKEDTETFIEDTRFKDKTECSYRSNRNILF